MPAPLKPFACTFPYDGKSWCLTIHARDAEEAKRRMERIGTHGTVDGEMDEGSVGPFVPVVCWIRNLWTGFASFAVSLRRDLPAVRS